MIYSNSDSLTLLSWNIAKINNKKFLLYVETLLEKYQINLFLFQEFKKVKAQDWYFQNFSYALSPNIKTKKSFFGVLSAFDFACQKALPLLTTKKELKYLTKKSVLVTSHLLKNGQILLVINIHAINFTSNKDYSYELGIIEKYAKNHKGPLILAGDFNSWNFARTYQLSTLAKSLSLQEVTFSEKNHIKKFFKYPLDHIFYRGLILVEKQSLKAPFSDHNPLLAKFVLPKVID